MSSALQLHRLDVGHLSFAADLHASALPSGLFTALGPRWLQAYYRTFIDSPYGVTLLVTLDGQAVGVLAGTSDTAAHRAWTRLASRRRLAALGVLAAARRPRVALLLARTRGRRLGSRRPRGSLHQATASPTAVLAYLAVVPTARALGVGAALVERFLDEAALAGAPEAMLVTLAGDAGAGRFYERLGWRYGGDQYNQEGSSGQPLQA